ncbi:hypothetical protein SESBI_13301 [Sesbania bispinosa]|nr:hypothetical protein SESBI_13301 [Sesbania bispinosa]
MEAATAAAARRLQERGAAWWRRTRLHNSGAKGRGAAELQVARDGGCGRAEGRRRPWPRRGCMGGGTDSHAVEGGAAGGALYGGDARSRGREVQRRSEPRRREDGGQLAAA